MRYLVLTDLHANLEGLQACLTDARAHAYDETIVLGDIVGYGADPNAVIEAVKDLRPAAIVRGNHDKVACGLYPPEGFRAAARSAAEWTLTVLTPDHRSWLGALPEGPTFVDELIQICHGSPWDEDGYILDDADAMRALRASARPLCLFGHTHYRIAFELSANEMRHIPLGRKAEFKLDLQSGVRYLVNPGAVGQPRDGDARAAYAIVDTAGPSVELYRVPYPFDVTQEKIVGAGLPEVLAKRLALGK